MEPIRKERDIATKDPVMPEHLKSHYVNADSMPWERTQFDGIQMKLLYSDPDTGMSTLLFKMAPGAIVPMHEHVGIEQTYVLEGTLEDSEGVAGPGQFVWRPGGNIHTAYAPQGAVILSFFTRPNKFFDGHQFFTQR